MDKDSKISKFPLLPKLVAMLQTEFLSQEQNIDL